MLNIRLKKEQDKYILVLHSVSHRIDIDLPITGKSRNGEDIIGIDSADLVHEITEVGRILRRVCD